MLNMIKDAIKKQTALQESADLIIGDTLPRGAFDESIVLSDEFNDFDYDALTEAEDEPEIDTSDVETEDTDENIENTEEPTSDVEDKDDDIMDQSIDDGEDTTRDPEPIDTNVDGNTGDDILDQPIDGGDDALPTTDDTSDNEPEDDILSMEIDMGSNTPKDILPVPPASAGDAVADADDSIMNQHIDSGFGGEDTSVEDTPIENTEESSNDFEESYFEEAALSSLKTAVKNALLKFTQSRRSKKININTLPRNIHEAIKKIATSKDVKHIKLKDLPKGGSDGIIIYDGKEAPNDPMASGILIEDELIFITDGKHKLNPILIEETSESSDIDDEKLEAFQNFMDELRNDLITESEAAENNMNEGFRFREVERSYRDTPKNSSAGRYDLGDYDPDDRIGVKKPSSTPKDKPYDPDDRIEIPSDDAKTESVADKIKSAKAAKELEKELTQDGTELNNTLLNNINNCKNTHDLKWLDDDAKAEAFSQFVKDMQQKAFTEEISIGEDDSAPADDTTEAPAEDASTDASIDSAPAEDTSSEEESPVTAAVKDKVAESDSADAITTATGASSQQEIMNKLSNITKNLEDVKKSIMQSIQ